jgi:hypothetical protein
LFYFGHVFFQNNALPLQLFGFIYYTEYLKFLLRLQTEAGRAKHKRQLANISGFRLGRSATLAVQKNPAELETAYRPLLTLIEKLNKEPLVSFGDVFFQDKTLPL